MPAGQGGLKKEGNRISISLFHEEGSKAPFDAESIKGGVCAADGGIVEVGRWETACKTKQSAR